MAPRDIAGAIAACRAARPAGWELVDYATHLVAERFSTYSVLHPLASPAAAFRRGRGFCTQYNGALAIILRELGVQAWLVYAARVTFEDRPDWPLGHTWVRVSLDGEVRDVCARSVANRAGCVHFTARSPVRRLGRPARVVTALGSFGAAVGAIVAARLRGQPAPAWVEHPRAGS